MKQLITILAILSATSNTYAQQDYKYSIGIAGGWLTTIAERGPKQTTEVGDVKFLHPWSANSHAYFDMNMNKNLRVGIELGLDQFDYGYEASPMYSFSGTSSGLLASAGYIYLYKAGVRLGYDIPISNRFCIKTTLNPAIGYFAFSSYLADTSNNNSYMHDARPPGSNKVQYITYPPQQKEGLHFTAKATAMLAYNVGKHLALTADVAYQQGFSDFLINYVSIRQYEPVTLERYEHLYYTKVNGSCFQFHFGLQYRFGKE